MIQYLPLLPSGPDGIGHLPIARDLSCHHHKPTIKIGLLNLRWEFDPAVADCRYRAPLAPRLAQPNIEFPRQQWSRRDSNPRPVRCERTALPTELLPQTCGEGGIRTHGRKPTHAFQACTFSRSVTSPFL
jgi:hypothetical protein